MFVYGIWLLMLGGVLAAIALWGRNLPMSEDWLTVAPLTGHEPDLLAWLWAQNNEHRLPLPRLLYLAVLRLSGGDYRSGMFFNALLAGAVCFALLRTVAHARGTTHYTDAFIPLILLHLGHWENLVWGWQIQFVLSTALTCGLLAVIVRDARPAPDSKLVAGVCLVLLPLTGGNGVLLGALLSPWFAWSGASALHRAGSAERRAAGALLACAIVAVVICALYFVGYEAPTWNPPSPGPASAMKTTAKVVAIGLGPAAAVSWRWSAAASGALLLSAVAVLAFSRDREKREWRRWGLLVFLAAAGGLALALGWGRSGTPPHPRWGLPIRYALLSVPLLLAAYFSWVLYGPARARRFVTGALLLGGILVLPINTREAYHWRDWYVEHADHVLRDLEAGVPLPLVADRHYPFLLHWDRDFLLSRLEMLRDAGVGPFRSASVP